MLKREAAKNKTAQRAPPFRAEKIYYLSFSSISSISAAALSAFSKTGLTDIEDIAPWVLFLTSDGWWMTGQTILVNGGYTTK